MRLRVRRRRRECHRSIDSMLQAMSPELRGKIDALIACEQK
jgi:hypothetical protein